MYQLTVFETAAELLDAFTGDEPAMPLEAYIVFDGDFCVRLSGVKDLPLTVHPDVKQSDVIKELFERAGARVHIT